MVAVVLWMGALGLITGSCNHPLTLCPPSPIRGDRATQKIYLFNRREGVTTNQPRRMVEKTLKVHWGVSPPQNKKLGKKIQKPPEKGSNDRAGAGVNGARSFRDPEL